MPVAYHGLFHEFQGIFQFSLSGGQTCQPVNAGALRFSTPDGFEECIIGFFRFSIGFICQSQIEITFAGIGVRIFPGLLFHSRLEVGDTFFHLSSTKQKKPITIVEPNVGGISFQSLQVIVCRFPGGMAILFQVGSCQIQIFCGGKFFGSRKGVSGAGNGFWFFLVDGVRDQSFLSAAYLDGAVRKTGRRWDFRFKACLWGQIRGVGI